MRLVGHFHDSSIVSTLIPPLQAELKLRKSYDWCASLQKEKKFILAQVERGERFEFADTLGQVSEAVVAEIQSTQDRHSGRREIKSVIGIARTPRGATGGTEAVSLRLLAPSGVGAVADIHDQKARRQASKRVFAELIGAKLQSDQLLAVPLDVGRKGFDQVVGNVEQLEASQSAKLGRNAAQLVVLEEDLVQGERPLRLPRLPEENVTVVVCAEFVR